MAQFQIRTAKRTNLHQMIQELSDAGWLAIRDHFSSDQVWNSQQRNLYEQIGRSLGEYVASYDLCGTSTTCSDEIEGAPWLDYDDNIYILHVPKNVIGLVDNLAFVALEAVVEHLKPKARRIVYERLKGAFNKCLNGFIYYNPICRNAEFCKFSSPVNPWRH